MLMMRTVEDPADPLGQLVCPKRALGLWLVLIPLRYYRERNMA
jgi:hypothetical protein